MADEGLMLVELPEAVSVADTDLVYLVTDLATLAASKRISIGNLKLAIAPPLPDNVALTDKVNTFTVHQGWASTAHFYGPWVAVEGALQVDNGAAIKPQLSIGVNPALSGSVRLQNVSSIKVRNNANTTDLNLASCTAADNLSFGDLGTVNYWQGSVVNLQSQAHIYFSVSAGTKAFMLQSGAFMPTATAAADLGQPGYEWNNLYLAGALNAAGGIGTTPLPANVALRDAANTFTLANYFNDQIIFNAGFVIQGTLPHVRLNDLSQPVDAKNFGIYNTSGALFFIAYSDAMAWQTAPLVLHRDGRAAVATALTVGTTPALSGALRLANDAGVYARNAANSADRRLLNLNVDNDVIVGSGGGGSTQIHGTLIYMLAGETVYVVDQAYFCPIPNGTISLGLSSNRWKDAWIAGTVTAGAVLATDAYFNSLGTTPLDATKLVGMVPPASLPPAGGTGDVVGPANATDSAIATFDGLTGKAIKNTTLLISGSRLLIGGTGASFPGLRNAGADLEVTTADSAQWAKVRAAAFVSMLTGNNLQDLTVTQGTSLNILTVSGATSLVTLTTSGRAVVFGGSGTSFSTAPLEIQAAGSRIAFHHPGVVASQLGVDTAGTIRTYDNPGTGYAAFASGAITAYGNISVGGNLHNTAGYVYPGNAAAGAGYQGSWYLASHSSYGLYSNTGLYCAGSIWTGGFLTGAYMSVGMAVHNGVQAVTLAGNNAVVTLAANVSALRVTAGGFSIQNINGGTAGQVLHVFSISGSLYLVTGGNLGGGTSAMAAGTGRTLFYDGGGWKLV